MRINHPVYSALVYGALGLAAVACERPTGFCQVDSDCANGSACVTATSSCAVFSELDMAAPPDLVPPPQYPATPVPTPLGSAAGDEFGYAIAVGSFATTSYAVFGAPFDHFYTGLTSVATLQANNYVSTANLPSVGDAPVLGDNLGISVSASGSSIAIGAYGKDGQRGAAYVFVNNQGTWTQQYKAIATDPMVGDYFGFSVSLSGDTLAVGAYNKNAATGAAYVFTRTGVTWSAMGTKLPVPQDAAPNPLTPPAPYDYFGFQVAATPNLIAVSAPGRFGGRGAVYLYTYETVKGWTLTLPSPYFSGQSMGDQAGEALQISPTVLAIGAPGYTSNAKLGSQGAVYLIPLAGTTASPPVMTQQPLSRERFGAALSLASTSGQVTDTLLVGAPGREQAFVFRLNSNQLWTQSAVLDVPADGRRASFGAAVATTGTVHLVGIRGVPQEVGSVYSYFSK